MKIHTTEALMKAEISRRSLMKTSALGSLALASSAFTLPFFPNGPGGRGSGRRESGLEFLHR
ncbi:putative dimethyl sulfoxide reductase, olydopterin dinucleotide binding subunit [Escherichia coli]|nr:putative dimethyl sulfoxide reductase, olydopterin dinucleotide binding subunit [Escherichia coli]